MRELGVNLLWEDSKDDDDVVTRAKARRMIDYLVGLNANSVALNFPFIMKGAHGNEVLADPKYTPSPERAAVFLEEAAASHLRVTLRPLLDERSLVTAWRGKIEPANRDKWFASYASFLRRYATVAEEHNVTELVVGVELNSLQDDSRWRGLITKVRQVYSGQIAYSENFDQYQRKVNLPPVDAVGVDAYFAIDAPDNASVATLTSGWTNWITRHAGSAARKLVLHEVGIAAENGAFQRPWAWGKDRAKINLKLQANWYQAVCNAAAKKDLAGLYFWNVRMHHNPGHENPQQSDKLTFVDRPAEDVLRDCYARLAE
jgi:hypothetical protein